MHVKICEAHNLLKMDLDKSDPYVTLQVKGQKEVQKTQVISNNLNPLFNQEFDIVADKNDVLVIKIFDEDIKNDDKMCDDIEHKFEEFMNFGELHQFTKELVLTQKKKKPAKPAGTLIYEITGFEAEAKKKDEKKKDEKKKDDKKKEDKKAKKSKKEEKPKKERKSSATKDKVAASYEMDVTCVSAKNLIAADRNGFSDPYVVLNIQGQKENVYCKFIENTLNPEWNETIKLNGYEQGKDIVEIWVYDKDKKVDLKKNDIIGYQCVKVPEIKWGEEMEFALLKVAKRKVDKKSAPGDAGSIKLVFNTNKVEKTMALHLRVIKGVDLPNKDDVGKSDPYCICKLGNDEFKTKVIDNNLNPQWNEEFHYMGVKAEDELAITVMDKDVMSDDVMGKLNIKVADLKEGEVVEKDYDLVEAKKGKIVLALHYCDAKDTPFGAAVKKVEKKKHSKEYCSSFSLGSYSSSYSTSFSGYTNNSSTLSALSSEADHYHKHHPVYEKKEYKPKPESESLKGVIISASNLIRADSDGTDSYVTFKLVGQTKSKSDVIKTAVIHDTENPVWNHEFEFPKVKKGDVFEITVWQTHKFLGDAPIGIAKLPVKAIDDKGEEQDIQLNKPKHLPKILEKFTEFGTLKIKVSHERKYKE